MVARTVSLVLIAIFACSIGKAIGQQKPKTNRPTTFWPAGESWNQSITTPKQFFGFDVGRRHLRHDQVAGYLKKIAKESDRITIRQYGQTHGRRPLLLLTITSPDNHKKIRNIQARHKKLSKPDQSNSVDIESLPVVINMGYGVHGDEPSATNTAPLVAFYLAAAQGKKVETWLRNCVILLDPSLNPDGFDRFARWANTFRGVSPNPDPAHAEHNQGWPAGRVNYYWFDLNRDWLPLVHPESRGRMRWYHQWKPNVVLDFHEMGSGSTYFFQPGIPKRTNPLTPRENVALTGEIAKYHSKAFDSRKTLYMTQELFDDFYMGKGSTYPDLHGSIGILFEQASSRGQVQKTANGMVRFPDTIRNQFTTSMTSLQATSDLRKKLLQYQRRFYQRSQQMAEKDEKQTYIFSAKGDRTRLQRFAATLLRHDIRCFWTTEPIRNGSKTFQRGSLVVPANQPEYRFIRSLFDRPTTFKENIFYDVSAWTLPLAFNLESDVLGPVDTSRMRAAKIATPAKNNFKPTPKDYAYLIDWRDASSAETLAALLKVGIKVKVATEPFVAKLSQGQRRFGYGTLVIPLGIQKSQQKQIQSILSKSKSRIITVQTGMTPRGIDLGSNKLPVISKPKIAMLIGRGTSTYECGEIWHAIDYRLKYPISLLELDRVSLRRLREYDKLIVSSGSYDSASKDIMQWVREGGTLIAVGRAASTFQKLSSTESAKQKSSDKSENKKSESKKSPIQKPFANARNDRALQLISGSILQAQVDPTHPLCYGITTQTLPVFRNHTSSLTPSKNAYQNPLVYTDTVQMSGYVSKENVGKLKGKASAIVIGVGRGRMVLLSDNPNFRGFWEGTRRVFYNSLFFGQLAAGSRGREENVEE